MKSRLHRRLIPWLFHHGWEFKWYYLFAFSSLLVLQLFQAQIPQRIRELSQQLGTKVSWPTVLVFVGLALGILFFRTLSRLLFFYPARVQQKYLRLELLGLLEKTPPIRYQRERGQIFQILFDDINNLRAFVGFGLLQLGNLILAFWVLVPKFNQTDSYLWPAFIPLFLSILFFSITTFLNQKYFKLMMEKKGEVQQYIIESYEARQTIKNFHKEDNFIKGLVRLSSEEMKLFFRSSVGLALTSPYVKLGLGLSLIWASILIRRSNGGPPDLVFFSGFLYLFLEPVMFISWVAVVVSQGLAAWRRIKELHQELMRPSVAEEKLLELKLVNSQKELVIQLPFWDVIRNFCILPHQWTVIVGETGCGKTHLLSQMATAFILKGDEVSMVQQVPYLFNDTIKENIFLGHLPNEKDLLHANELLKIFQLDDLAPNLEEVLNLEVGENGKRLSGGQIKRVALIRSLLSGAKILIWDDPFSSVDVILEKKIISRLRESSLGAKRTFIISGHRLTTVKLSDQVICVEKGFGIRSQGSSSEILKEEHVSKFFKQQMVELSLA